MDRGRELDGKRKAQGADRLDRLLPFRMDLPPSRVVPENAGRDQARGRQGEAAQRAPHEVLRPHGVGHGLAQRGVAPRAVRGVEEREVGVLLGRFDQARPELLLAQDRLEVFREQVARQLQRPGF